MRGVNFMKKGWFIVVMCFIVCFVAGCGNNSAKEKNKSLEDEVIERSLLLQETYGKISNDVAIAYCDGEEKYLILYYYGIGKESQNLGDTYCIYITDKDGKTEVLDPNGDFDDLSVQLMEVNKYVYEANWTEYETKGMEITYEQYNDFEEGFVPACYASNDKLIEEK